MKEQEYPTNSDNQEMAVAPPEITYSLRKVPTMTNFNWG